jgi:thiamine pyrophosphate-dependent acetolactate synthase large subunit-like protein
VSSYEFTLDGYNPLSLQGKNILRIDIDPREFDKAPFVHRNFEADASEFAEAFLVRLVRGESVLPTRRTGATSLLGNGKSPFPQHFPWDETAARFEQEHPLSLDVTRDRDVDDAVAPMDIIAAVAAWANDDALFVADSGNAAIWACHYLQLKPAQDFHIDINLASMGSGILSSLGHSVASPGRQVVCFVGDGTFFMNGIDISTAADYGIDIVWIVFNDGKLGMVEQGNKAIYGWSRVVTYQNHDIAALAMACGARSSKVSSTKELGLALASARGVSGPTVVDVCLNDAYLPQVYSRTQKPRQTDMTPESSAINASTLR